MADVIAMVADGIATCVGWCFCPTNNRWNSQMWQLWLIVVDVITTMWLADVVAMVADGIGHCWNVSMY